MGNKDFICSKLGEIKSHNDFYDYDSKYVQNSVTLIPDDLPSNIVDKIREYACKIFVEIGVKDYCRIDFFYDNESVYVNEINTIPGFTNISMFPKLMENENISYTDLISILINNC